MSKLQEKYAGARRLGPLTEGKALRLVLISVDGCQPCDWVKSFLPDVVRRVTSPFQLEIRQLSQEEFFEECFSGKLVVNIVPALLLYSDSVLVGRAAGWKGKHGTLDETFVERWLKRHGGTFD